MTVNKPKQQRRPTTDDENHVNSVTPFLFLRTSNYWHNIAAVTGSLTHLPGQHLVNSVISNSPKLFTNMVKRTRAGLFWNRLRGGFVFCTPSSNKQSSLTGDKYPQCTHRFDHGPWLGPRHSIPMILVQILTKTNWLITPEFNRQCCHQTYQESHTTHGDSLLSRARLAASPGSIPLV